jgi:hypothetical protein
MRPRGLLAEISFPDLQNAEENERNLKAGNLL